MNTNLGTTNKLNQNLIMSWMEKDTEKKNNQRQEVKFGHITIMNTSKGVDHEYIANIMEDDQIRKSMTQDETSLLIQE